MYDFNDSKDTYKDAINASISFIGAEHDFFIVSKGEMLNAMIAQRFAGDMKAAILDVGCGHGYVHGTLVNAGHKITGVEIASDVLDDARKLNPAVDYRPYDGVTLPFADNSFNVVVAMCVIHHVPVLQWRAFVKEAYRVLKPGGFVAVFEHNPVNPITRYVVANSELDIGVTLVRRRLLEGLFREAGATHVRSRYIFFTPFGHRFFRWLDRKLSWLPFGAQYYTLAER